MNREILFRGKCIEDHCDELGKWIYGYLVYCHDEYEFDKPRVAEIIETDAARLYTGEYNYWKAHEVDPDTVGQYIGLNDANGNKIFEGDILESTVRRIGVPGARIIIKDIRRAEKISLWVSGYEVAGNIWDNPEMLEVEKNEQRNIV